MHVEYAIGCDHVPPSKVRAGETPCPRRAPSGPTRKDAVTHAHEMGWRRIPAVNHWLCPIHRETRA